MMTSLAYRAARRGVRSLYRFGSPAVGTALHVLITSKAPSVAVYLV